MSETTQYDSNRDDLNREISCFRDWCYSKRKKTLQKLTPFLNKWLEEYKAFQINNKKDSK